MDLDKLSSIVCRICFLGGFAFVVLVFVEELANWFGSSLITRAYSQETLLNIGAVLFVIVIALLLRQIREGLKTRNV